MTNELQYARDLLLKEGHTMVILSGDSIECFRSVGIGTLLYLLDHNESLLKNDKVADKVVGKAAAMLFVLGQVGELYAEILSDSAKQVLTDAGLPFDFGSHVPYIKNRRGDGMCPMEEACISVGSCSEARIVLQKKLKDLANIQSVKSAKND